MRFSESDIRRVGEILAHAARTEIMPRYGQLAAAQIRQKSSALDVVSEADEAAEAVITRALLESFPGALVIGEESAYKNPSLLESIATADLVFVVDPIDGTKNFVSHLPLFAVMAATIVRGQIASGVIFDPAYREWAYALRDGGAWLEREGGTKSSLQVAQPVELSKMEGIATTSFLPEPLRSTVQSNLKKLASTNAFRCAAHEYRMAASGYCHFLFYNRLMPWDHAAGWLLHHEAGGYSAHFDGSSYHPTHLTGGLICTPDEASWHLLHDALLGS
jgi:fructose-1,6-bisphosphatase/inositol monophosphatase family enzyme